MNLNPQKLKVSEVRFFEKTPMLRQFASDRH
jgi:hypothetical protein